MLILHPTLDKVMKISDFQTKTFTKVIIELIITSVKVFDWKSKILTTLSSIGHKISIYIKTC